MIICSKQSHTLQNPQIDSRFRLWEDRERQDHVGAVAPTHMLKSLQKTVRLKIFASICMWWFPKTSRTFSMNSLEVNICFCHDICGVLMLNLKEFMLKLKSKK